MSNTTEASKNVGRVLVRRVAVAGGLLSLLYCIHLAPEPEPPTPEGGGGQAFEWGRDAFWRELENEFLQARQQSCEELASSIGSGLAELDLQLAAISTTNLPPGAPEFDRVETDFQRLAPMISACPEQLPDYMRTHARMRGIVKRQSEKWSIDSREARERLYRLLYGGRAAVEEAMLQAPRGQVPDLLADGDEPSETPSAMVHGVRLHSGDILVSRGGAAASALIARGNDFVGNFSHVALVHVDADTCEVSVIESHIESGVGVFPIVRYLADTKLRIMVLRLRADLSQVQADPMLPHKAASGALHSVAHRRIPYDFAMDFNDPSKQFCSEVASAAYRPLGVKLWMGISHLSSPGLVSWLAAVGVRHFQTQEPSDLEYDPQLRVVAEWRDPGALFKDHVDNAVIDVMLETAEAGEPLRYNRWLLPPARVAKAFSTILNRFGAVGPVPEGMSATTALRVDWLKQRHASLAAQLMERAGQFQAEQGYAPPYWELIRLARRVQNDPAERTASQTDSAVLLE